MNDWQRLTVPATGHGPYRRPRPHGLCQRLEVMQFSPTASIRGAMGTPRRGYEARSAIEGSERPRSGAIPEYRSLRAGNCARIADGVAR